MRVGSQARGECTAGEVVNLMSVDAEHIKDICSWSWWDIVPLLKSRRYYCYNRLSCV